MSVETQVLIVGAGISGLTCSLNLARYGVRSCVVEKHPYTAHLPKAHTLNQRSMEIFRQLGLTDQLKGRATPSEYIQRAAWRTSFGGDEVYDGKVVVSVDAFGGGSLHDRYTAASPEPYSSFHQVILEPFLVEQIEKNPLIDLRFDTEITEFEDLGDSVRAVLDDRTADSRTPITAEYAVAADGGRFFQPRLGYELEGVRGLGDMITLWFKADLSPWMDDDTLLNWFVSPDSFGMSAGVLIPVGYGRHSQEWVLHFGYPDGTGDSVSDEEAVDRMLNLFKLPDLEMEIIKVSRWKSEQVMADRFKIGRVIGTGDAIHRHPPTLGIGMNSAIGDSHNLAWKLAYVVNGQAPDALLDTFDAERRPVLETNSELAIQTNFLHQAIVPSIGMVPGGATTFNEGVLTRYFEDSTHGRARRLRTHELVRANMQLEHQALDLEIGYRYGGPAVMDNGDDSSVSDPMLTEFAPSAEPGRRLPHAWLKTVAGNRISTIDLIDREFTLITADEAWAQAGRRLAEEDSLPLKVTEINDGNFTDESGTWREITRIGNSGALLVRPDQHIAWRATSRSPQPEDELSTALSIALCHYPQHAKDKAHVHTV